MENSKTDKTDETAASHGFASVPQLKVKRRVAMPVLQFPDNASIVVRIMTGIVLGKELKEGKKGKPKMGPAHVCTVAGMSGEQRLLICGEVLKSELEENYPGDGYVGAWFHITKHPPRAGRDYNTYTITEIEPPEGLATAALAAPAAPAAEAA